MCNAMTIHSSSAACFSQERHGVFLSSKTAFLREIFHGVCWIALSHCDDTAEENCLGVEVYLAHSFGQFCP